LWNTNPPAPVDNITKNRHAGDVVLYGKRVTSANVRRIVRKINWVAGNRYEMYRDDYSVTSPAPVSNASRLYDANYYVMNEDYRVYICIENGSSGTNLKGNVSLDEPTEQVIVVMDIFGNIFIPSLQVISSNLILPNILLYQIIGQLVQMLKLEQ
jgi:hypothetical protein